MGAKLSGGGGKSKGMQPNSEPNVIPFIDIMLVLLIIFMVAAPIPTVDIRVDLPVNTASPPLPDPTRQRTMVEIDDKDGVPIIYVDREIVTLNELGQKVFDRAVINNSGLSPEQIYAEARIVVRANQETRYANVVAVMGKLQEEKFAKSSLLFEAAIN
jgi:biopolymer transport protein ExbD